MSYPKKLRERGLSEGCVSIHAVQICYYACIAGTESMRKRVCGRDDPPAGKHTGMHTGMHSGQIQSYSQGHQPVTKRITKKFRVRHFSV